MPKQKVRIVLKGHRRNDGLPRLVCRMEAEMTGGRWVEYGPLLPLDLPEEFLHSDTLMDSWDYLNREEERALAQAADESQDPLF